MNAQILSSLGARLRANTARGLLNGVRANGANVLALLHPVMASGNRKPLPTDEGAPTFRCGLSVCEGPQVCGP